MTDDTKDPEIDEETAASAEPDFSPASPAPISDDDAIDDDPHASFDPVVAAPDDDLLDPYGVGAPKTNDGEDFEDDDLEEEEDFESSSDAY